MISYDISSDRLRRKTANELLNYGKRVQYSVFECRLTRDRYKELYKKLKKLVTDQENSVRIYSLCESCADKLVTIGASSDAALPSPGTDEVIII